MTKEIITPVPYNESMILTDKCWIAIKVSSLDESIVKYFNQEQDEDEFTFKDFVEDFFGEEFSYDIRDGASMTIDIEKGKATAYGAHAAENEDYDDERNITYKSWYAIGENIAIFQTLDMNTLPDVIRKLKKQLRDIENDEIEAAKDSSDYNKDKHAYYGVKKSDF